MMILLMLLTVLIGIILGFIYIPSMVTGSKKVTFSGRAVLITGAANGLGRILCFSVLERLAQERHQESKQKGCLILLDYDVKALKETKSNLEKSIEATGLEEKVEIRSYACDLSNFDETKEVFGKIKSDVSPLHVSILVNNAGTRCAKRLSDLSIKDFDKTFRVNCFSHFIAYQSFIKEMKEKNDGHIVGLCSLMSHLPAVKLADYCGSKSAAYSFYECLRLELSTEDAKGLNVLVVCPYVISTKLFKGTFELDTSSGLADRIRNLIYPPLKPRDVAERILDGVQRKEQLIFLYGSMRSIPFVLKLFPVGVQQFVVSFSGGTTLMERLEE